MYPKQRPVPPEVSTWMEKDLALGELTAATRLMTNDARQNLIVSRRFFSDLLSLSFERYRKILACNYDKNSFLKNQRTKSETSMPGLRPYVDKLTSGIDRPSTSGKQANKNDGNSLNNPSTESLFFHPETKSDLTFNRRPHTSVQRIKTAQSMRSPSDAIQRIKTTQSMRSAPDTIQRIKTAQSMRYPSDTTSISASKRPQTGLPMTRDRLAQPMKSQGDIIPITTSKNLTRQRPVTRRQISRERLEYLAQPKQYRFQSSGTKHIRPHMSEQTPTPDELFGELSERPQTKLEQMHDELLEKCEKAIHGECFRHLVDGFSQVHHAETSNLQTVKNIIQSNASLQDDKGHWRMIRPTAANSRPVFRNHRQTLADQLHKKLDVFLIDVGA